MMSLSWAGGTDKGCRLPTPKRFKFQFNFALLLILTFCISRKLAIMGMQNATERK